MGFGKSFRTRREANAEKRRRIAKDGGYDVEVRRLSKKLFPRRKKLYHVGTWLEFLNFA